MTITPEEIEKKVAEYERRVYGEGNMPVHSKSVYRAMLRAEDRFWTYFDRDYVYGQDEGGDPPGYKEIWD